MSSIRNPLRAVGALFILAGALFGVWASRIPAVTEKHDLTPNGLGLLLLVMAFGSTVAFALSGWASDRIGAPRVARAFGLACSASLILAAFAPTVWLLAIALFLFGATMGGLDVAMNAWATEVDRQRSRPVISALHAMFSVGAGLGAASGYLAATVELGMPAHFAIASVFFAAICLWFAVVPWPVETNRRAPGAPIYAMPKGPLIVVAIIAFCASIGEGGMADWSAIFLVRVTEASEADAALGYTIFSIAMVAMRLIGDRFVLRFGAVAAGRFSGAIAAAGSLIAITFGTFPAALIGFGLMGIGYALIMPLAFTRAANDGTMSPGAAIAAVATLGYGGVMLGPPLIGFIAGATSIRTALAVLSVFALLIIVLAGVLAKPSAPAASQASAESAARKA